MSKRTLPNYDTLGERIRHIREVMLGETQDEFLRHFDSIKHKGNVSKWETNQRKPSVDDLILIAGLGMVSLDWLIAGTRFESLLSTKEIPSLFKNKAEIKKLINKVEGIFTENLSVEYLKDARQQLKKSEDIILTLIKILIDLMNDNMELRKKSDDFTAEFSENRLTNDIVNLHKMLNDAVKRIEKNKLGKYS